MARVHPLCRSGTPSIFPSAKLLLADEPTGNLDPGNSLTVLNALAEYADAGNAVLLVTHDPGAAQRADRVIHLDIEGLISPSPVGKSRDP